MILRVCLLLFGLHIIHTCPAGSQKDPKDQTPKPSTFRGNEPPNINPPFSLQPPLPPQPPVPPPRPPMPPMKSKILKFGSC